MPYSRRVKRTHLTPHRAAVHDWPNNNDPINRFIITYRPSRCQFVSDRLCISTSEGISLGLTVRRRDESARRDPRRQHDPPIVVSRAKSVFAIVRGTSARVTSAAALLSADCSPRARPFRPCPPRSRHDLVARPIDQSDSPSESEARTGLEDKGRISCRSSDCFSHAQRWTQSRRLDPRSVNVW